MNQERSACFNCKHWVLEPGALDERLRIIARRIASEETGIPPTKYGKCRAVFINKSGQQIEFGMGTLAPTSCIATDDDKNILFEAEPVG